MDGKIFFKGSVTPPISNFVFDLQRFNLVTEQATGTTYAFSCVKDETTYYGEESDFTTENVGTATQITLLNDITLSTGVTLSASTCTVDLGGKTVTYAGADGRVATFDIAANANVTMTNGNINYSSSYTDVSENIIVNSGATLNLGNATADSSKPLNITCNGSNYPVCVLINGGTVNVNNDATLTENPYFAIMYNWSSDVTSNCVINGGTVISHGTGNGTIYYGTIYNYIHYFLCEGI